MNYSFIQKFNEIKDALAQTPSKKLFEELEIAFANHSNLEMYFYTNISNHDWLEVFKSKKLYNSENVNSSGYWPPLYYLTTLSQTHPDDVVKIIESDFPDSLSRDSILVTFGIIKKYLDLLPQINQDSKLVKWLENFDYDLEIKQGHSFSVVDQCVTLMKALSEANRFDEQYVVFKTLFGKYSAFVDQRGDKVYDYKYGLEKICKDKNFCIQQPVFNDLCDWTEQALMRSQGLTEDKKPDDHYYYYLEDYDHYSNLCQVLVHALLTVSKTLIENDSKKLTKIINKLEQYNWNLFKRIELFLLKEYHSLGEAKSFIVERIKNFRKIVFDNEDRYLVEQYDQLLVVGFQYLNKQAQNEHIQAIQTYTFSNWDEGEGSKKETIKTIKNAWFKERYTPIQSNLEGDAKIHFQKLEDIQLIAKRSNKAGFISNKPNQESFTKKNLPEFVKQVFVWSPKDEVSEGFNFPSWSGVADLLQERVKSETIEFYSHLDKFKSHYEPVFHNAIFSAWREVLKNTNELKWDLVLDFAESTLKDEKTFIDAMKNREGEYANSWRYYQADLKETKKSIVRLIESAFENQVVASKELFKKEADKIWNILDLIANDPDPDQEREKIYEDKDDLDAYDTAINSVRGDAVEAMIRFALWQFNESTDNRAPDRKIKEKLEWYLTIANETSLAVRSVFGHWLPWLIKMDEEWVKDNLDLIFPKEAVHSNFRKGIWQTYLRHCGAYNKVYQVIESEYDFWIDQLDSSIEAKLSDDNLSQHLVIYYGRELLTLERFKKFFDNASAEMCDNVLFFIGRALRYEKEDLQKEEGKKTIERFKELLEYRVSDKDSQAKEFNHFDMWLKSDLLDLNWRLNQLDSLVKDKRFYPTEISSKQFWIVFMGLAEKNSHVSEHFLKILEKIVVLEAFQNESYIIWHKHIIDFMNSLNQDLIQNNKETVKSIAEIVMKLVGSGQLNDWYEIYSKCDAN